MSRQIVTVAIPVLNGGELLVRVLRAVASQRITAELEILVADSGSTDGSAQRAREAGARVIEIERSQFGHGRTRNLLLGEARGDHVALLTHDAEPLGPQWLATLLSGFTEGEHVGLVYGPYVPRADAPPAVRSELERWFASLAPGAERLEPNERDAPAALLMGRRGFFTDANACILRTAWERVPYRDIAYAEDRALALDMMRAGYAKVYVPDAAVLHSHDYTAAQYLRRAFDEGRAVREVYGWKAPLAPRHVVSQLRGELGALRREGAGTATLLRAGRDHALRLAGAALGARAGQLPHWLERRLSLERRVAP